MAIVSMQKAALVVHKKSLAPILDSLQEQGAFEVAHASFSGKESLPFLQESFSGLELKIADLRFVIRYLSPFAEKPGSFREKFLGQKVESSEAVAVEYANQDFSELVRTCALLEEKENTLKAEISRIAERVKALSEWGVFDLPLQLVQDTASTRIRIGEVDARNVNDFEEKLSEQSLISFQKIFSSSKRTSFAIFFHKSISPLVEEVLREYAFQDMDFGETVGTVQEELSEMKQSSEALAQELLEIEEKKKNFAKQLPEIKLAYDVLCWKKEQKEALEKAHFTKQNVIIFGWLPTESFESVRQSIRKQSTEADLFPIDPEEGEQPPVQLKNKDMMRPFENILSLFGSPSYSELDPTPYLAPFFLVFFGFCLTDAGYGVFMFLTLTAALHLLPLDRATKDMVRLLIFGSLSTVILGVLFGGYFGMTYEQLPWFVNPETGRFYGQVFNPVDDLVPYIMAFTYGLAIVHLFVGVFLSGVNRWKSGKKQDAVLVTTSLILLLICIPLLLFLPPSFATPLTVASCLFSCVLVWKIGLFGFINEMLSWLSNVLSYSRLFALGLATGIIALAFNSIALILAGMMPIVLGIPVAILIILFGHALNMTLNVLGAFIHSARLQFVEFFGKFLEGGGKSFRPLSRKYIYLFDSNR